MGLAAEAFGPDRRARGRVSGRSTEAACDPAMCAPDDQIAYWDSTGAANTFILPVELVWFRDLDRGARILDCGCDYGRVATELTDRGVADVSGVDVSPALIARARRLRPDLDFQVLASPPTLPTEPGTFDAVLLVAVLTCVLEDHVQQALVAEVIDALKPGGLLSVGDFLIGDSDRHRSRYDAGVAAHAYPYGVSVAGDGAVVHHHDLALLHDLVQVGELVER